MKGSPERCAARNIEGVMRCERRGRRGFEGVARTLFFGGGEDRAFEMTEGRCIVSACELLEVNRLLGLAQLLVKLDREGDVF